MIEDEKLKGIGMILLGLFVLLMTMKLKTMTMKIEKLDWKKAMVWILMLEDLHCWFLHHVYRQGKMFSMM